MKEYNIHTLSNGIRILHKEVYTTRIVHCGFILDIGSRDEGPEQQGLAHFWEHMAFKGTKRRKAFHIINKLESVGGELNAYTTKEKICFYASVLQYHFESALELLTDITFDSIFPEKQIENERKVILEEMAIYYDDPEDAIQDDFDSIIFPNHPLGNNILGTAESIKSFQRSDFKGFIKENLNSERLILSCVGNITFNKTVKLAEKYLKDIPRFQAQHKRLPSLEYQPVIKSTGRHLTQAQCAIGSPSYPVFEQKRFTFFMLINILGGPGLNSRLNMALREKYGFVYSIEANYSSFTDTGIFAIYFGTDPSQLDKSIRLVEKELDKLKEKPLGTVQLHRAKEQLMGQLAMSEENYTSLMLMLGKSMLDLEKIHSLEEIFDKIRKVSAPDLMDLANEMFDQDNLSYLKYVPK
ncbi:MAG: M16 family metallopeptidase [Candidatus Cyclobacteriaceae bacterium M3_2C_046]